MFLIRFSEILPSIGCKARWVIIEVAKKAGRLLMVRYKERNYEKMHLIFAFVGNCYWSRRIVRDDTLAEVMVGVTDAGYGYRKLPSRPWHFREC